MTLAAYKGHEPRLFLDYLDLGTGKALYAEPGGTYDMTPVGAGRLVPDVPEQWFTPVEPPSDDLAAEVREGVEASERGETEDLGSFAEHAGDEDPETDLPQ